MAGWLGFLSWWNTAENASLLSGDCLVDSTQTQSEEHGMLHVVAAELGVGGKLSRAAFKNLGVGRT